MDSAAALPPAFWRLTAARAWSTLAANMLAIVVGWSIYHQTHSTLALGMAGLLEAIPAISLALYAGWLVDRGDALAIYRRAVAAQAVAAAVPLLVLALSGDAGSRPFLYALYGVSVLAGVSRAFLQPCLYTLVPRLVVREALPKAATYSASVLQAARVLGPGVGGILYGAVGVRAALVAALSMLMLSLLALRRVVLLPQELAPAAPSRAAEATAKAMFEGLHYVWRHPILLPALSLDMVCVLFSGVTAVLPAFAEEVLLAGPTALGWLRAAPAVGAVVGSLLLSRFDIRARAGRALLWAVAGFGAATMAFALSRSVALSFGLLLVSGLLDSVSVLVRQLVVQLMSPPRMRGRISAVNAMFIGSSNELGEFESGVAAWQFGLIRSVLGGCGICLAVVGYTAACNAPLRALDLRKAAPSPDPG